jgi:hypothetical protein
MAIVSAERAVEVVLRVEGEELCSPPDVRGQVRATVLRLLYAGNGYVRAEVQGHLVKRNGQLGAQVKGHWSHTEGAPPRPDNRYDTSHAPRWVKDYAARYAPADFTAVS